MVSLHIKKSLESSRFIMFINKAKGVKINAW